MFTTSNGLISEDTNRVGDIEKDEISVLPHEKHHEDFTRHQDKLLSRLKRKAIGSEHNLWPGGAIVYTLAGGTHDNDTNTCQHNS